MSDNKNLGAIIRKQEMEEAWERREEEHTPFIHSSDYSLKDYISTPKSEREVFEGWMIRGAEQQLNEHELKY